MAAAKGKVIPAGIWGKQKTMITMVAIGALLLAKGLGAHQLSLFPPMLTFNSATVNFSEILLLVADAGLLLATIWTVLSGAEYMISAMPLFQKEGLSRAQFGRMELTWFVTMDQICTSMFTARALRFPLIRSRGERWPTTWWRISPSWMKKTVRVWLT